MIDAKHHDWIRNVARTGYAARGAVYLIVGILICIAAFSTSEEYGTRDALRSLTGAWWGTTLLWAIVIGFAGYVAWRLIQSLLDTDDHGWTIKGISVRLGLLASAVTYTTLAIFVLGLLGVFGSSGGGGEGKGPVLETLGSWFGDGRINLAAGVIFAIVAGAHLWKAATQGYEEHFRADPDVMRFVHPISITGLAARGLVFAVISFLLLNRWWDGRGQEKELPGMTDALDAIREMPMGEYLYFAAGVGLAAFALYSLSEAKWRQINVEDADKPTEQSSD